MLSLPDRDQHANYITKDWYRFPPLAFCGLVCMVTRIIRTSNTAHLLPFAIFGWEAGGVHAVLPDSPSTTLHTISAYSWVNPQSGFQGLPRDPLAADLD